MLLTIYFESNKQLFFALKGSIRKFIGRLQGGHSYWCVLQCTSCTDLANVLQNVLIKCPISILHRIGYELLKKEVPPNKWYRLCSTLFDFNRPCLTFIAVEQSRPRSNKVDITCSSLFDVVRLCSTLFDYSNKVDITCGGPKKGFWILNAKSTDIWT